MRRYGGLRKGGRVYVSVDADGTGRDVRPLPIRHDLRNHSPAGFEWGYGGSGPAQLALALCADALGDDQGALAVYQEFKRCVLVGLMGDRWELTVEEVVRMCRAIEEHRRAGSPAEPTEVL